MKKKRTRYAAGGRVRKGTIPNPLPQSAIIVNPSKKQKRSKRRSNIFPGDPLGHQIGGYYRQGYPDVGAALADYRQALKQVTSEGYVGFPVDTAKMTPEQVRIFAGNAAGDLLLTGPKVKSEKSATGKKGKKAKAKKGKTPKKRTKNPEGNMKRRRDSKGRFLPKRYANKKRTAKKGRKKGAMTMRYMNPRGRDLSTWPRDSKGRLLPLSGRRTNKGKKKKRGKKAKSGYSYRYNNPKKSKKMVYRPRDSRGRYMNPENDALVIRDWKDAIKPAAAGAIGYALPGIIDTFSRSFVTNKLSSMFGNMEGPEQKAQMTLSIGSFALTWLLTTKVDMFRPYKVPAMIGSGVRALLDLMDGILPQDKEGMSGTLRQMFGLTGTFGAAAKETGVKVEADIVKDVFKEVKTGKEVNIYIDKEGVPRILYSNKKALGPEGQPFLNKYEFENPQDAVKRTHEEAKAYYAKQAKQPGANLVIKTLAEADKVIASMGTSEQKAQYAKITDPHQKIAYANTVWVATMGAGGTSGFYVDRPTRGWTYNRPVGRGPMRSNVSPTGLFRAPKDPRSSGPMIDVPEAGNLGASSEYTTRNPFGNPFPNVG